MKLLVYSWFPVMDQLQLGGAQQVMHDLLLGGARAGLDITVLCPETAEEGILRGGAKIQVKPVIKRLENRALFPYEHLRNLQIMAAEAEGADVVWVLDQAFHLDIAQPVVLTLDNFSYDEEMESFLSLTWDMLVLPSKYLYRIALAMAGPDYWEGGGPPVELIPHAVDHDLFRKTDPEPLRERLGLRRDERYLLFPHRPDPNKGFRFALQVTAELQARGHRYKLLIPINNAYRADAAFYRKLRVRSEEMGIGQLVEFHDWIRLGDLPAYFSLGSWVLALGTVPEGFGLTPVQAINCGTPVVSTRAGALGELFPPGHGIDYVSFDGVEEAADAITRGAVEEDLLRGQAYARQHYSIDATVERYLKCFASVRKSSARYNPRRGAAEISLSPWCRLLGDAVVWHDYRMRKYKLAGREREVIDQVRRGAPHASLKAYRRELAGLLAKGILLGDAGSGYSSGAKRQGAARI